MTVRLVGGPFHGRIMPLPGGTESWEGAELGHWDGGSPQSGTWVPERRHRYRLDPHWSEFLGREPLPFVYDGIVGARNGATSG
jgi:hypothetical protein